MNGRSQVAAPDPNGRAEGCQPPPSRAERCARRLETEEAPPKPEQRGRRERRAPSARSAKERSDSARERVGARGATHEGSEDKEGRRRRKESRRTARAWLRAARRRLTRGDNDSRTNERKRNRTTIAATDGWDEERFHVALERFAGLHGRY